MATYTTTQEGYLQVCMVNGVPDFYIEVDGEELYVEVDGELFFVTLTPASVTVSVEEVSRITGIPVEELLAIMQEEEASGSTTQEDPNEDEGFGMMDEEQDEKMDEEGEGETLMEGETDE